jgi:hypothetical protein
LSAEEKKATVLDLLKARSGVYHPALYETAEAAAHMLPEVPRTFPEGQSFLSVGDPAWKTDPNFLHGFVFLHMRDPRFGWLRNILSRDDASRLASSLQKDMKITPLVPGVE